MVELDSINRDVSPIDDEVSLEATFLRDAFSEWLSAGNIKKYSTTVCMSCLDKVSEYAIQKKICSLSLWSITKHSIFQPIYKRLLEAKLLRVTEKNTYKGFIVAGQLYLKFLKEKPWSYQMPIVDEPVETVVKDQTNSFTITETLGQKDTESDEFVAWLTTQLNANGTLYLKHVAQRYANNIHTAPLKLDIQLTLNERDVFKWRTVKEFDRLCEVFRNAPNYREVNRNSDHGAFSAGLGAYRRYLQHLAEKDDVSIFNRKKGTIVSQASTSTLPELNADVRRVDFTHPELCAYTNPVECIISGHVLRGANWNWRDLLVAITEHFLNVDAVKVQSFILQTGRPFLIKQQASNSVCRQLSNQQYVIVSFDIPNIVRMIGKLCAHCGVDHREIMITYILKGSKTVDVLRTSGKVDFTHPELCAYTNPVECIINGHVLRGANWNWRDLLVAITEHFLNVDAVKVQSFALQTGKPFLINQQASNSVCRQLSNQQYVIVSYGIPDIVRMIGKLCAHCGVDHREIMITYILKGSKTVDVLKASGKYDVGFNLNENDSDRLTQPHIRSSFKEWLSEQYPDWSPNTLNMHCSDAFYLFNNNRGVTLAEVLRDDDGMQKAYVAIESHFKISPTQTGSPATSARGYTRSLRMFKRFIEERFPELLSYGGDQQDIPQKTRSTSVFADIIDFEEGRDGIRRILNTHFQSLYGYSNINILWDAAQSLLSMFLNDNAINSAEDLWEIINRAFDKEFVLSAPHIWKTPPTYPQNIRGLVINLARQNGGVVTREQIDEFFTRVKIKAPINSSVLAQDEILFYNNRKFVEYDSLNLNTKRCNEISKALNNLFSYEDMSYIVLRDIKTDWYSCLPELSNGTNWTPLLLQEVLRVRPNIGYRTEMPIIKGQDLDTLRAAIVPNDSDILTFADVVHRFCYNNYKLPHRMTAEGLRLELRSAGFLEGNELIWNMHKALRDHRFAFTEENKMVMILER